jgi:phospholipid/cholesterol/gamma-HCH transport system permease protein
VLAARIGASYTAELGTMTATDEVEAIEAMGIGPLRYLVIPRFFAIVLMTPCLSVIALLSGIIGAAIICKVSLGLSYGYFYDQMIYGLLAKDVISGIIKSVFFGAIIGSVSCYKGLVVEGGSAGVGTATTSSVVIAVTTVIGCDTLCNIFMVNVFP